MSDPLSMPQDLDAERAVIGAMLAGGDYIDQAISMGLAPESFYRPGNAEMCRAAYALHAHGDTVDQITLVAELERRGTLERVGGRAAVIDAASAAYSLRGFEEHVSMVIMRARQRELVGAGTALAALGRDAPEGLDELRDAADKRYYGCVDGWDQGSTVWDAAEAADRGWARAQTLGDPGLDGVRTGYRDLDEITGGFKPGQLAILAARPSVGKTALALNLALGAAARGVKVRFYTLEMDNVSIVDRLSSIMAGVPSGYFERNEKLPEQYYERLKAAFDRLYGYQMEFDENPAATCAYVRSTARHSMRGVEPGKGLVVVDYLQLMRYSESGRFESRQVEVAEISRSLKRLAKEVGQPVLALSQLSRQIDARADKRPVLSDLRESGAIEQDADVVMFLDRSKTVEEAKRDGRPEFGFADVIVAKHRNGALGTAQLSFRDACMQFGNKRN